MAELADPNLSAVARHMSAQQALALPSPAASNTVVINARCSLRIEADQRVIVVAGLPVHHYRGEDAVAEAYAMVFFVKSGGVITVDDGSPGNVCVAEGPLPEQPDVAPAWARSVRTGRRHQGRYAPAGWRRRRP